MAAPDKIKKLVADFERLAAGPAPESFDEAQLRVSFVNPFWEALGWNVRDPGEVVIEKRVAVRAATKHADYCFQLGGKPQFVVEAKDYFRHRSLDDRDIIFQAKRYGYNLPADFAVLTNFGDLRVYDAGLEPIYENPARGFIKKLRFRYPDYVARWDELAAAFSREAVAAGALRDLLPKARRARNKEALDRRFFERLNEWRAELARVIALRNPDLSVYDINEAVQRILDRCIFIRVIEDRAIEATELLRDALNRWRDEKEKPLYQYVVDKFRALEPQYNGELFYRHFSENLIVDDRPLRAFLESLYYPRCPYQFNVVGVELLGTVYERFLGSTIRLTPSHRAVVEEKPEVRKAGGVYYTPKYIVDYIVENTVGELLKKCKTPADVAKLKILDPACGSGSFLLGAFQRLIDWHEDYFNAHPEKIGRGLAAACWEDKGAARRWRLTAKFKGRILVNNIFGVDIDPQACEVTRMSLYLRVLEDVQAQYLMKTALLPPLDANIKCGNSLIGSDYFEGRQGGHVGQTLMSVLPDEDERRRVNPFDWDVEFPQVFGEEVGRLGSGQDSGLKPTVHSPASRRVGSGLKPTVQLKAAGSLVNRGRTAAAGNLWFVSFVTHNSRVSERMVRLGIKRGEPVVFTGPEQVFILEKTIEAARKYDITVLEVNVLPDHVHMVVAADSAKALTEDIRKLKGFTARAFAERRAGAGGEPVWARKFNRRPIKDDEALAAISAYVRENHHKHAERWGREVIETYEKKVGPILDRARRAAHSRLGSGLKPTVHPRALETRIDSGLKPTVHPPAGGFDAVIGNPPYVRQERLGEEKDYYEGHYGTYVSTADLYVNFVEKALKLTKDGGRFAYIVSNKWMRARYGAKLRKFVKKYQIEKLVDFGELKVFQDAATFPLIMVISKKKRTAKPFYAPIKRLGFADLSEEVTSVGYELDDGAIGDDGFSLINKDSLRIIDKMKAAGVPLGEYVRGKIYRGILTGFNKAFVINRAKRDELIAADPRSAEIIKPFVVGDDVRKYHINFRERYLIFTRRGIKINDYPAIKEYLSQWKVELTPKKTRTERIGRKPGNYYWYEIQDTVDYYAEFDKPKIVFPDIAKESRFAFDDGSFYTTNTCYIIPGENLYLIGLLNSVLYWFYYKQNLTVLGDVNKGGRLRFFTQFVENIPVKTIIKTPRATVARHDEMVTLVEEMLALHKRLAAAKSDADKTMLQRAIAATDRKIDNLVYELYGLTDEEIKIVEDAS